MKELLQPFSFILTFFFLVILLTSLLFPFFRKFRRPLSQKGNVFSEKTLIDFSRLVSSIRQQDPRTIAKLLFYLDSVRAEEILNLLEPRLQAEVLFYLSELKK